MKITIGAYLQCDQLQYVDLYLTNEHQGQRCAQYSKQGIWETYLCSVDWRISSHSCFTIHTSILRTHMPTYFR